MLLDVIRATVRAGKVVDLGQTLHVEVPHHPAHAPYMYRLTKKHGDQVYAGGVTAANDMITMGTHIGTHIDGLGHIACCGQVHGPREAEGLQTTLGGFREIGIDTVAPIVARGVLLDVAGHRGVDCLPAAEAISADELAQVARDQQVEVRAGDCLLVRTGWTRHWTEPRRFVGIQDGSPGPDHSAAVWLAERGVRWTGSDTLSYERLPAHDLPVHVELLVKRGIHIIEALQLDELARLRAYEFLFVALPLKIQGGTGSPLRPIAIC